MSTLSMPRIIDVSEVLRHNLTLDTAKNCFFVYFIARRALKLWRHVRARGIFQSFRDFYALIIQVLISFISSIPPLTYSPSLQRTFGLVIALPSVRKRIDTEMDAARAEIERKLMPQGKDVERHLSLPRKGQTLEWILEAMEQMDKEAPSQTDYREGKLSGAVYRMYTPFLPPDQLPLRLSSVDGGDDMERVLVAAFQRYCVSNPLHPDVFPAIRKMEAEIVAMCLRMYNNPIGAGVTTSGGTESILMSVKTHRDWACAVKGISEPEMYASVQFHLTYTLKMLVGCPQGCPSIGPRCVR